MSQTFSNPQVTIERIPITRPIEEIVGRLNAVAPTTLRGYPSALLQLSGEAQAGHLRIAPLRLRCVGEPLLPEVRARLVETWGVPVHSQWVASETGTLGYSCLRARGLHLNDDLVIVEPVDRDGRPVQPGERAAKIYVTNLFNILLPLIRFEVSDEITVIGEPCACGSAHTWVEDVQGRLDDSLTYPERSRCTRSWRGRRWAGSGTSPSTRCARRSGASRCSCGSSARSISTRCAARSPRDSRKSG